VEVAKLHGPEDDLRRLQESVSGVVVIAADSGVGKSEVIGAVNTGWANSSIVAGALVLDAPQGSLQNAIADAVADCLRSYSANHPGANKSIWQGLMKLLDRAASASEREAVRIVVAHVFASIESKLGHDAADEARAIVAELVVPDGANLSNRLQNLTVRDLASDLIAVACEVAAHTKSRLILRFDRGEFLSDQDFALLGELADRQVDELLILVACSTNLPGSIDRITTLETRGARRFDLNPLSTPAIHSWLEAESVDKSAWSRIITASSGYPFFIADAIRLVRNGLPLDGLKFPRGFESVLQLSWNAINLEQQVLAMKIAGFADPPTTEFLALLLGLDLLHWQAARGQLVAAGVFVTRPDGSIWFHDRRRDYIWNAIMDSSTRASSADKCIAMLREWFVGHSAIEPWIITALPSLIRASKDEAPADSYLRKLVELDPDGLRILFAQIELVETHGSLGQFTDTRSLAAYAVARFGAPRDPIAILENLADQGFIVSSANEHTSITTLVSPDAVAYAALLSEIEFQLAESPIPQFGSTVFDSVLRPILGQFKQAVISVGDGGLRTFLLALESMLKTEPPIQILSRAAALGVTLKFRGQSVTTTVLFESEDERDVAEVRVREYEKTRLPDEPAVATVAPMPGARIHYARYEAIAKLTGKLEGSQITTLEEFTRRVEVRDAIREVIRGRFTGDEASAFGWRDTIATLIDDAGSAVGWAEITIAGSASPAPRLFHAGHDKPLFADPLLELKLRRDGALSPTERTTRFSFRGGSSNHALGHPLTDVVKELKDLGRQYNQRLARISISTDETTLADLIDSELSLQWSIVEELARHGLIPTTMASRPTTSLLVVLIPQATRPNSLMWSASSYVVNDARQDVTVKILDVNSPHPPWSLDQEQGLALGVSDVSIVSPGPMGYATHILQDLLGLDSGDFNLSIPEWVLAQINSVDWAGNTGILPAGD
jgi:hypothetical protein